MKLETYGILIELRPFGDRDVIAKFLTADYGILTGMIKAGQVAKKNKPIVGSIGDISWVARLDSQLGAIQFSMEKNLAVNLMADSKKLNIMNSVFALVNLFLPERENFGELYHSVIKLLQQIQTSQNIKELYIDWEIKLLRELGYALDLSRCSGCGATESLTHLSPKTGRAVCSNCAAPYLDRLYKLPIDEKIVEKFIQDVCNAQGVVIPFWRKSLKF